MKSSGWKHNEESKKKISLAMTGRMLTGEHREKLRLAKVGVPLKEEHRRKISDSLKGIKHSEDHKRKVSESKKGSKCWNWRGGISKERAIIWSSREYRSWREEIFKRDDYTCVLCGHRNKKGSRKTLNADHIKSFCDYPELRFVISNGRTLCVPCHRKTPNYGVKKKVR